MQKPWRLATHDPHAVLSLAKSAGVSGTVAHLLLNRGIFDADAAKRFLGGSLADLHSPQLLPNIDAAAQDILNAIRTKKSICVYGDYDTDGVTGTAILLNLIRTLGHQASHYVPNRIEEGYGLNPVALDSLKASGVELVITVDCGIASLAEADHARSIGLELIVTDHHEMKDRLPKALHVVHPRLPGSTYPFAGLCGAGVAFKLAWAMAMIASGSDRVTPALR